MKSPPRLVSLVSLGCAKNLVDSEVMLGRLATGGFAVTTRQEGSDVVVINTCGFLQAAESEALGAIQRAVSLKRRGKVKAVVVAGCLPQRYGPEIAKRLGGVDAVVGLTERDTIADVCRAALNEPVGVLVNREYPRYEIDRDRLRVTPRHYAYLRVAEGCNHSCAFCIIPFIRGPFRSKPMEELLREARELAASGARELSLIGQDTSEWGLDLYRETRLEELLARLAEIEEIHWIRLNYMYPTMVTDRQIREIARNPKVVKYLDMPIQHTTARMLRAMRRGITRERQEELIGRLRSGIPGLALRTTVIVGFPGETAQDHEEMLSDLSRHRFERLGAFAYSEEAGTAAASMPGRIGPEEKARRYHAVLSLQRRISREIHRSWVGRRIECVVEDLSSSKSAVGRTYLDAPQVDGRIFLQGKGLRSGQFVQASVTGSRAYDLLGRVVEESLAAIPAEDKIGSP